MTAAELTAVPTQVPRLLRTRRAAIRLVYTPLALLALVMSQGLIGQLLGSYSQGGHGFAAASTTAWKVLSLWGVLGVVWTAGRNVRFVQWYFVGQLTWAIVSALAPQTPDTESATQSGLRLLLSAVIFVTPWLLLAPERRELLRLRADPDRVALVVLSLATPLLIWWTVHNRGLVIPDQKGHKGSGLELRFDMVGLTVVFLTVGLLAALRPGGTRCLLAVVALAAAYVGVAAEVCDGGDIAAPGRAGGVALLVAGGVLASRSGLVRREAGRPGPGRVPAGSPPSR